jgi:CMP-N,N'-diacetyllegionaminic acid synthase
MYAGKRILAVVPARGGSKGIPLKNIRPLGGKPLIAYAAETVKQLAEVDRAVVSTDHEGIAEAAGQSGLAAPFRRPPGLGGDRIGDWDVLTHALRIMEELDGVVYDVVLMLQPTCPLRTPDHVRQTFRKLIDGGFDAVWTLSPTDSKAHPLKQLVLNGDLMDYYDPRGTQIVARQQLTPVYHRNGAAYAITRQCLLEKQSIKGDRCGAVIVPEPLANIDTEQDIAFAEFLLSQSAR